MSTYSKLLKTAVNDINRKAVQRGTIVDNALMPNGTARPMKKKMPMSQHEQMRRTLNRKGRWSNGVGVGP